MQMEALSLQLSGQRTSVFWPEVLYILKMILQKCKISLHLRFTADLHIVLYYSLLRFLAQVMFIWIRTN